MVLVKCQQLDGAYLQQFTANVLSCTPITPTKKFKSASSDTPQLYECILDDTILFPSGGGQNTDFGDIKLVTDDATTAKCINVERRTVNGEQKAVHTVDTPLPPNTPVHMTVDWQRRYDFMQQHTSQHLVSAVALNKYAMRTVSWNMSAAHEPCFIVFESPNTISDADIAALESAVNELIRAHTPVNLHIFDSFDAAQGMESLRLGAQFDKSHQGEIRVIEIAGVDTNTCCGTHIQSCSEIQALLFSKVERTKGQIKIHFWAGQRVIDQMHSAISIQTQLNASLSCSPEKHADAVVRMQAEVKQLNKRVSKIEKQLAVFSAKELYEQQYKGNTTPQAPVVSAQYTETNVAFLQEVADQLYIIVKGTDGVLPILVMTGIDADNDSKTGSMLTKYSITNKTVSDRIDKWFKDSMSDAGLAGKGGGKPGLKQGKVTRLDRIDEVVQRLRDSLSDVSAA